ncbi:MAG: hypothetical protein RLZZ244_3204 [Verrucomicrobiota bacterium]|jgi:acylphosphatase
MIGRQVFYEGKVQGVGFRYSTKQLATGFEVTGWVRNLPDGRVELQVMGEPPEVEDFLQAIAESHLKGHIKRTESHPIAAFVARGFEIRP